MGTLRWEKESSDRYDADAARAVAALKLAQLDAEEAQLALREQALKVERLATHAERAMLLQTTSKQRRTEAEDGTQIRSLRSADPSPDATD
jgi:lipid II:glycine glycyltransferase (peptidoglycan interpeptide bridge formation enzyme)